MDKNIQECLKVLAASAQMIQTSVRTLICYLEGQADAEEFRNNQQTNITPPPSSLGMEKQLIQSKTAIEEIEEMLIELKINGSVRQRNNGLIEFRSPIFGSVYGRTPEELQEKLKQKIRYEKAHVKKPAKKKKSPLLSEFYENNYLPYKQTKKLAESTLRGIEYNFKFIRKQEGFNKPIIEYSSKDIEEFLLSIPQTRKRQIIQGLLNNMFTRALADALISANPCAPLDKMEHDTDEGKALSFEEQKRFFHNLFNSEKASLKQQCYFIFVYLTGTRRNEALDMTVADVDFQNNILHIPGSKTEGSNRYIPLFPLVAKTLRCMHVTKEYFKMSSSHLYDLFCTLIEEYKLHDLRHTFGTIQICVEKIETKTVSLWMGHTNIQTTLKNYTHPEQLDRSTFLRGDLTEEQKRDILKGKYAEILQIINDFLDKRTQIVPKF